MIPVCAMPNKRANLQVIKNEGTKRPKPRRPIRFKRGQRVLCVNTDGHSGMQCSSEIEKGKIYKVTGTAECQCGESHVLLDGIKKEQGATRYCICGRVINLDNAFRSSRFSLIHLTIISN